MTIPSVTVLSTPPEQSDPDNFNTRADTFLGELPTFGTELNSSISEINNTVANIDTFVAGASYSGTSTTSITVGTGSKSLTTQAGLSYTTSMWVAVQNSAQSKWIEGWITSYTSSTGAMVVNAVRYGGSGTDTSWYVNLSNPSATVVGEDNAIINGDFNVWQIGTSSTLVSSTAEYIPDMFEFESTGGTATISRQTNSISLAGTKYMCRMAGASGVSAMSFYHKIEATNAAQFAGEIITVSAKIENNSGASITPTLQIYRPTTTDDTFSALTSITSASSGDGMADGTEALQVWTFDLIGEDTTKGLQLSFNVGAITTGTVDIAEIKLELGDTATPFRGVEYGVELAKCQRYFERQVSGSTFTAFGAGVSISTTVAEVSLNYTPPKRALPTISTGGTFGVRDGASTQTTTSITTSHSGLSKCRLLCTVASGLTVGNGATLKANDDATAYIDISARL